MENTGRELPEPLTMPRSRFPIHGWFGLSLVIMFWIINWTWDGPRTNWAFFPMWLGYCLVIDGLVYARTRTSLLTRDWRQYVFLFVISAPVWWTFELLNLRTQNWAYIGLEHITVFQYAFWTTLSFSTVVPAVFGSAEFIASFQFMKRIKPGLIIRPDRLTTNLFFSVGWLMLALLLLWPEIFFPFIWLSPYFILEPLNVRLGNRTLAHWTQQGDWRPVFSLWLGVLMTGLFWEMWNYFSYPKWIYHVPWGGWLHIFEMPLLGYGGYLPFSLELFALYHLIVGLFGHGSKEYLRINPE